LLILLPSLVTQFISIFLMLRCPARSTLFPYTTLFRSNWVSGLSSLDHQRIPGLNAYEQSFDAYSGSQHYFFIPLVLGLLGGLFQDRKSTRLNSSHVKISYAVFCLKKKKRNYNYK